MQLSCFLFISSESTPTSLLVFAFFPIIFSLAPGLYPSSGMFFYVDAKALTGYFRKPRLFKKPVELCFELILTGVLKAIEQVVVADLLDL